MSLIEDAVHQLYKDEDKIKKLEEENKKLRDLLDAEIVTSMRLEREVKYLREWANDHGHMFPNPPLKLRKVKKPIAGKTSDLYEKGEE